MILRKLSIWVFFCASYLPDASSYIGWSCPWLKLGFQWVHAGSVKQTLQICVVMPFLEQLWFAGPWSKLFAFVFVWFSQHMNIYSVGEKSFFFFFKQVEKVLPLCFWYSLILRTKLSCLISTFLLMCLGFNFIALWWWWSQMCDYKL